MPASEVMINAAILSVGVAREGLTVAESEDTPRVKQVPFIPEEGTVVRIRVNGFVLRLNDGRNVRINPFLKSLDLFYSRDRNQVIKIVSVWPDGVPGTRFPQLNIEEDHMKRIGHTFSGIPKVPPRITLVRALESALGAGNAKQIVAYYVLETHAEPKTDPHPVWVINCWGVPPFAPVGGPPEAVPVDLRNHLRSRVDAETGKWYGSDTIPQPRIG